MKELKEFANCTYLQSLCTGWGPQVLNWGGRMEEMNIMLDKAEFIGMNVSLDYGIYNPSKLP